MERYFWHAENLPAGERFTRVHGVLVCPDGRFLLRYKNGEARVTGGHIDPEDADAEAALKREVLEEINCRLGRCDYIGYVEMQNPETGERELWARMVGLVEEIGAPQPDPDRANNWIYGRKLVPRAEAERAMNDTFPTNRQALAAAWQTAEATGYFTEPLNSKSEILNPETHD